MRREGGGGRDKDERKDWREWRRRVGDGRGGNVELLERFKRR